MEDVQAADQNRGPARPERLVVDFFEQPDAIALHKKRGGGPAAFLLLWLTGWTVGCVFLAAEVIKNPAIGTLLFAVPFWASWLFVAALLVWMLFGQETLLLRSEEAIYLRKALVTLSSRLVPRAEIQGFRECRSAHQENDRYLWGIEMATLGKPVRFAFRLPDQERAWLIYQLNRFLATPETAAPSELDPAAAPAVSLATSKAQPATKTPVASEILQYEQTLAEAPSDCDWHLDDESNTGDWNNFALWQRGRLAWGAVATLLFINAFWNGIVSVFVLGLLGLMPNNNLPQGAEWWGMFFFLIPFEVIGLVMFLAFIVAVLEPLRRTIWRFEQDRIERQVRYPIYRRTRAWQVVKLDRLELRSLGTGDAGQPDLTTSIRGTSGSDYKLVFVSADNVDLCAIDGLTQGEARWLARIVLDRRPLWLVAGRSSN